MHAAANADAVKGHATRAPGFNYVATIAARFDGTDRCSAEIVRLILFATACLTYLDEKGEIDTSRTLSTKAQHLLAVLAQHVHTDKWQSGQAFAWVSNDYLCMRLATEARCVRRLLAELETAGYIVRRYNGRNQRLDRQGIDLRPFGARLDDIEAAVARQEEMLDLQRAERHAERMDSIDLSPTFSEESTCMGDSGVLHKNNLQSSGSKEPVEILPSDLSSCKVRASDKAKAAEMFDLIVVASPTFRSHLDPADQRLPTPSTISAAAVQILAKHFRNLRPDLWPLAVQTHGFAVAVAVLAAAVDKAGVKDRTRYLASMLGRRDIGATITLSLKSMVRTAGSA